MLSDTLHTVGSRPSLSYGVRDLRSAGGKGSAIPGRNQSQSSSRRTISIVRRGGGQVVGAVRKASRTALSSPSTVDSDNSDEEHQPGIRNGHGESTDGVELYEIGREATRSTPNVIEGRTTPLRVQVQVQVQVDRDTITELEHDLGTSPMGSPV